MIGRITLVLALLLISMPVAADHGGNNPPDNYLDVACVSPEPWFTYIKSWRSDDGGLANRGLRALEECRSFERPLTFWRDETLAVLEFTDGDVACIVRGHDAVGFTVYAGIRCEQPLLNPVSEDGWSV